MREVGNKPAAHRIGNAHHYNRDRCRRVLDRRDDRSGADDDEINLQADPLLGQRREIFHLACGSTVFDGYVSSVLVAQVAEPLQKDRLKRVRIGNQSQKSYPWDFLRLLRFGYHCNSKQYHYNND